MPQQFVKDPDEVLDYQFNFAAQMTVDSDTITGTPTVAITPSGELALDSQANSTTTVTVWLSGGVAGTTYKVECNIATVGLRTWSRTIKMKVRPL